MEPKFRVGTLNGSLILTRVTHNLFDKNSLKSPEQSESRHREIHDEDEGSISEGGQGINMRSHYVVNIEL